tara:strand:- start:38 stop:751 length:714 start_codon:yes stop_codon:yes gene_type:complete
MAPELGLGNSLSAEPVSRSMLMNAYSVDFDGTNQYVATTLTPNFIHTNATMSYWCNLDNFTGYNIMGMHNSRRFYAGFFNQTVAMGVQNVNNLGSGEDVEDVTTAGKWHHICLVANGGTATFYLDGISRGTMSYTQDAATNPNTNLFIGATSTASSSDYHMEGLIDEVAIFNSALSAAQVSSIYNGGKPQSLASYNPVGWWRMGDNDGGTGSTITDQGSGGNNGTLTNSPAFSTTIP